MLPDEVVVTALVGLLTSVVTAIGLAALGTRSTHGLGPPAIGMTQVMHRSRVACRRLR